MEQSVMVAIGAQAASLQSLGASYIRNLGVEKVSFEWSNMHLNKIMGTTLI